jgi:hypothetical protein
VAGGGGEAFIRAGDRAPDVAFTHTRSNGPTTLFELMVDLRPVVLFNGIANSPQLCQRLRLVDIHAYSVGPQSSLGEATSAQLADRHGDFAALYGLKTDFLCLIRPDGHVGLVQSPPDESDLNDYLALICAARGLG